MAFKAFGMNAYQMTVDGYWVENGRLCMPHTSAVYFVFTCRYNTFTNPFALRRLLYIGQAVDVQERLSCHEKLSLWRQYCGPGETICFAMAEVPAVCLDVCESALIFKHQPPCNLALTQSFPHRPTTIWLEGKTELLCANFRAAG